MFLYFNGCSYTMGMELDNGVRDRFSTIVSNYFKADHLNDAKGGDSNDEIVMRSLEFLEDNVCDYAIIMLTHAERMNFNKSIRPHTHPSFYEEYYDDEVGSLNFYKNRYILEQEFDKKNIPLLLLQYHNVYGDNVWSRRCKGKLQTIANSTLIDNPLDIYSSSNGLRPAHRETTLLGRRKNKKYYYSDTEKKTLCHFNIEGHKRVANYIIGQLT